MVPQNPGGGSEAPGGASANGQGNLGGVATGAEGVLEVDQLEILPSGAEGTAGRAAAQNEAASDRAAEAADGAQAEPPEDEDGAEVPEAGGEQCRTPPRFVTKDEIARALKLANGEFQLAAATLGIPVANLRNRVSRDRQLRAVWLKKDDVDPPTELDVLNRTPPKPGASSALAEAVAKQNQELMRKGLEEAGIDSGTINKLRIFESFGVNSGHFLVASLDVSHKMLLYSNVALLEEAEHIRENYLKNDALPPEVKIEWQRAYNEIADILGKGYERILAGTQALAKLMNKDDGKGKEKRKPGFRPLEARRAS